MGDVLSVAREVLDIEADAIKSVSRRIGDAFVRAVESILDCKGRVVVVGMGKSGIVGKKIAATLSSTGTPAFFLHPAEAMHGDLGMVMSEDIALLLSNSGQTKELLDLIPFFKRFGVRIILFTGNLKSALARESDVVIDISVEREACPLGLAPTASTTVMLAVGDALASALLQEKGFKAEDFAIYHPGGRLGRRLLLRVSDLMHKGKELPLVRRGTVLKDVILEMTAKGLGAAVIVDDNGKICGIFTDGDLRRLVERNTDGVMGVVIDEVMNPSPKVITADRLAVEALKMMENFEITVLPVVESGDLPVGMVHFHDILKAGIV